MQELFELWTNDSDVANSLATSTCQDALNAQMLHEGITRASISQLLGTQHVLDDGPDEAAPAAASDGVPESTPDGAPCDRAPSARSPPGGGLPSSDAAHDGPQTGALPPRSSGAPDGGTPALPADDGCVLARAPPYGLLLRLSALHAQRTPSPRLALTHTALLCSSLSVL